MSPCCVRRAPPWSASSFYKSWPRLLASSLGDDDDKNAAATRAFSMAQLRTIIKEHELDEEGHHVPLGLARANEKM